MLNYLLPILFIVLIYFLLNSKSGIKVKNQGWKTFFYPDPSTMTFEKAKSISFRLLLFAILLLGCIVTICVLDEIKKTQLEVGVKNLIETPASKKTNDLFDYHQATDGIISFSNTSVIERLLFFKYDNKTIIDCLFFLFVTIILYKTFKSQNKQIAFSQKISTTFNLIGFVCSLMFVISGVFERLVLNKIIVGKTNSQYQLAYTEGKMDYLFFWSYHTFVRLL